MSRVMQKLLIIVNRQAGSDVENQRELEDTVSQREQEREESLGEGKR